MWPNASLYFMNVLSYQEKMTTKVDTRSKSFSLPFLQQTMRVLRCWILAGTIWEWKGLWLFVLDSKYGCIRNEFDRRLGIQHLITFFIFRWIWCWNTLTCHGTALGMKALWPWERPLNSTTLWCTSTSTTTASPMRASACFAGVLSSMTHSESYW